MNEILKGMILHEELKIKINPISKFQVIEGKWKNIYCNKLLVQLIGYFHCRDSFNGNTNRLIISNSYCWKLITILIEM